jgi:pyrophosphatase PpaX
MLDSILFDLDGTLLDTNELIIESFKHALETHQLEPVSREMIIAQMGRPLSEMMAIFSSRVDVEEMVKTYREFNIRRHDEMVIIFPHVQEAVIALHAKGLKLGVVTSKVRVTVRQGLQLFGLDPYFSAIVTSDDVRMAKPDPESVLLALNLLGSKPENALMVGDSQFDLLAARAAGVRSAGVAWSLQGEVFLSQFNPNYILRDMLELLEIVAQDADESAIGDSPRGNL